MAVRSGSPRGAWSGVFVLAVLGELAALAACAGGGEPAPESPPAESSASSSGGELAEAPRPSLQVQGLLGTIPARKIEDLMASKLPAFQRCFFEGAGAVEFIGGEFRYYARVRNDGSVEYAYPKQSSVGHRETELCLLELVKRTRFPKPQGGDAAELAWGFALDPQDGVRAPVSWSAERAADAITAGRSALEACGLGRASAGRYRITAYVARGGGVMAVGASTDSIEAAENLDCIVAAVKGWQLPDPGSYPAKVSFDL
jgi:hypothetical protein